MNKLEKKRMNIPESKVEIGGFVARFYDQLLRFASFGRYSGMIKAAIADMDIQPDDAILDMGCGTGYNNCLMAKYLGKGGKIVGLDISKKMKKQFDKKCQDYPNISFIQKRIEDPLPFHEEFDKVFISLVFHGFPNSERKKIAQNAFNVLKSGGQFIIFDFNEFDQDDQPWWFRYAFRKIECPLAFEFITIDWKDRLSEWGFDNFNENLYFSERIRLLKATKV
jgi:demethylmenaquinone methyltransferase/2-methoxy-6-polyprenyl-1,4-benzoquinol methylase